jgi:putative hemolysin
MKRLTTTLMTLALVVLLLGACIPAPAPSAPSPTTQPTSAKIANPASENCTQQGGTLSIAARGDGGQYGICTFEDSRQCEEWAMFRGDCPVGGLKVTGIVTPAAQYCAIAGGAYTVTGNSGKNDEQGTCTFKNGSAMPGTTTTARAIHPLRLRRLPRPQPQKCRSRMRSRGWIRKMCGETSTI